jgi:hypothetical protein
MNIALNLSLFSSRFTMLITLGCLPGISISTASAENPWHEDSRVTIDEELVSQPEEHRWSEQQEKEKAFDESKYPPLDEDKTLGITMRSYPVPEAEPETTPPALTPEEYVYPDMQYGNQAYRNPGYGYQGYPGGYGYGGYSGYNPGGYGQRWPGSGRGGFPFGGNSWGGMPFGMGDNWMPFGSPGYW